MPAEPGESRFHAAGENPGFMFERLVATVTGLSKTIDRIDLYEATDVSAVTAGRCSSTSWAWAVRRRTSAVDSPIIKKLDMAYRQALNGTADVLGIELTHIDVSVDATTLPYDIEVLAGTIDAGTVVGQRFSWVGHWSGRPLLAIHEEWVLTRDLPQWGLKPLADGEKAPLIRAVIKGVPSFELQLDVGWDGEVVTGTHAQPGHLMIAMGAVRAVPDVLAQPPGIVTAPVFGAIQLGSTASRSPIMVTSGTPSRARCGRLAPHGTRARCRRAAPAGRSGSPFPSSPAG